MDLPQVTDLALSRRLERAEAKASAAYVESRARMAPERAAEWRDVGGNHSELLPEAHCAVGQRKVIQ